MTIIRTKKAAAVTANQRPTVPRGAEAYERKPDWLDYVIDRLEPVMPDMSVLGAVMLMFVVYLAMTGSDFGCNEDTLNAMQQAQEAASNEIGYVPF